MTDKQSKATNKKSNPALTYLVGALLFMTLLLFGVDKLIEIKGKQIAEQAIAGYLAQNPPPKVMTINRDDMFSRLSSQSEDKVRVLTAINALTTMMERDGYIVFDSSSVLMASDRYAVRDFSLTDIEQLAEERGIKADEQTQQMIREAEAEAKRQLKEIEQKANQFMQSFGQ